MAAAAKQAKSHILAASSIAEGLISKFLDGTGHGTYLNYLSHPIFF
jgi:hypothetical protein